MNLQASSKNLFPGPFKSGFFLTTFAKTQGEKNSANLKTQGLLGAKI